MKKLGSKLRSSLTQLSFYFDLKQSWPQLAGYQKLVVFLVVSDAVQHGFFLVQFTFRDQAGQVEPASHVAALRIDNGNPVIVPDICVNRPLYILELVKLVNRTPVIEHRNRLCNAEAGRIQKSDPVRAVAQNQRLPVSGQSPPLAL